MTDDAPPGARFRATIELGGKTATGIVVPPDVVDAFGAGKRPPVRVTLNGYTYRSTVASVGGRFMVGVSADVREHAGVAAGDVLDVDLELDTEVREVTVPADLTDALDQDAQAREFFNSLSYSNRLRIVLAVDGAKTAETRQRRIDKAVADLHAGRK